MEDLIDYYKVGASIDNPVISNSAATALNPEQGGSIQKLISFFSKQDEEKEITDTTAKQKGKILHRYIEKQDDFALAEVEKPTDMMADFVDNLQLNLLSYRNAPEMLNTEISTEITSDLATENARSARIAETRAAFTDFSNYLKLDLDTTIRIIRQSRGTLYSSYSEVRLLEHFKKLGKAYFDQILKCDGKIVLNKKDRASMVGMIESLERNMLIASLLNLSKGAVPYEEHIEKGIYWQEKVSIGDAAFSRINCKCKPDRLIIDHSAKVIKNIDLKTKAGSLYDFHKSVENYQYHRQHAFYKKGIAQYFKTIHPDLDIRQYSYQPINVVVESTPPYLSGIYYLDTSLLSLGAQKAKSLLERFAWHKYTSVYNMSKEEYLNKGIMKLGLNTEGKIVMI